MFASKTGEGSDHRNIGGRVLSRAVNTAKLGKEERDGQVVKHAPTFHSLRDSHGSALIASGWDLEEVSARLGHRDLTVTARTYVHAYESSKRSAARFGRLEAMYGGGSRQGSAALRVVSS
jgi:integrase